jgi:hypothetical protein
VAVALLELVVGYQVFNLVVVIKAVFSTSLPRFVISQTHLRGTFDMGTAAPRRWSWTRCRSRRHRHHHAARSRTLRADV